MTMVRCVARTCLLLLCVALPSDASQRLTILHSNDVHGHLRPCSYPSVSSSGSGSMMAGSMLRGSAHADLSARRDVGGIARRATLARRIRADLARQGTPAWLIDAGDIFFYSAFSNEYHGDADVIAMNRAGYDFATLGNHEFDITAAQLRRMIGDARFHFLCANVTDSAAGRLLTTGSEVRQVGQARVGIFGLVTDAAALRAARLGLEVEDATETARATVAQLRHAGRADLVVLISHCGEEMDRRLATSVPGIDVIVGAHSHTRLPQGELVPWSDDLRADESGGTVIVQAGEWGVELGRLDLLLERNTAGRWRVSRYREQLIPVTGATPDDPAVAAVLDSLWAPCAARYDEVIATASADFADREDDLPQNALFADLVRRECGVEVEFESRGGVHWPIVAGAVTRAMLPDLDQHSETVVTFGMRGAEIRRFVEESRPVASGLRYRLVFGRLEALSIGDAPLDSARVYSCAAGSALLDRMTGYEVLAPKDTGRAWSEVVLGGMRRARTLTPAYDGRRIVVEGPRSRGRSS